MSTQPEALRLAELLEFESEVAESCGDGQGAETTKVKAESAAQLRAQHKLIQMLTELLGGVLLCERNSDGLILLNGWQEEVIRKEIAAAEAHK